METKLTNLNTAKAELNKGLDILKSILTETFDYNGCLDVDNPLTKKEVSEGLSVTLDSLEASKKLIKTISNEEDSLKHQLDLLLNAETQDAISYTESAINNLKTIRLTLAEKEKSFLEGVKEKILIDFLQENKLNSSIHAGELGGVVYNEFKGATTPTKIAIATTQTTERLDLELMWYTAKKQELIDSLDGLNESLKELLNKKINSYGMITFKRIYKDIVAEIEAYKTIDADSSMYKLELEGVDITKVVDALKTFGLNVELNQNTLKINLLLTI